ncbi:hypothetical protein MRX96_020632 [Rhipicephalus microplus]
MERCFSPPFRRTSTWQNATTTWPPRRAQTPSCRLPLALVKLALLYGFAYLQEQQLDKLLPKMSPSDVLGPDWDLYVMTVMALLLAVLVYFRRA